MYPVLFQTRLFGLLATPWSLHTYGVCLAAGFLLGLVLASRHARERGRDPEQVIDLGFYLLLSGLAGSRLVFILTRWGEYAASPWRVLVFWQGGLVWYGGFLGAGLFMAWYCRRHRLAFFEQTDLLIPYGALGHALGRLGCFAAGCCFGAPTQVPWAVTYPLGSAPHLAQQADGLVGVFDHALPVHPTPLYEMLLELALFVLLVSVRRRRSFAGQLFVLWLAIYALGRFVIELFRGDKERGVYLLSTSQLIAVGTALALALGAVYLRRRRARTRLMRQPQSEADAAATSTQAGSRAQR